MFNKEQKKSTGENVFSTKIAITALVCIFFFLSYLYIIYINHMTLVIIIFIAKYMNNVYFTKYFFKMDIFGFKWSI